MTGGGATATIPVVHDPHYESRSPTGAEHYYRVVAVDDTLMLVYVGADGILGTEDDALRTLSIR